MHDPELAPPKTSPPAAKAPAPGRTLPGSFWRAAHLSLPHDIDERLRAGGTVLEIDCGGGMGCLALAEAYPPTHVVGHDRERRAIGRARRLARAAGLADRVTFVLSSSEKLPRDRFDLVTLAEQPGQRRSVELLNAVRNALRPTGACLLIALSPGLRRRGAGTLPALAEQAGFSRIERVSHAWAEAYQLRR